ncbi:MAG TPA: single-stranded DNA-binding protein [Selenomonadales bacterium]|nr:single-stranded DNA-binding protein [Selenomonadales bacterium]
MITGTLSGRLTADPVVRQGQNGNFTTFGVAVNHGKKDNVEQVTFVDCTANAKTGELVAEHFKKGNVFVGPASFQLREYTANDGQKRQVLSASISMIDWTASQTTPREQQPAPVAAPAPQPAWGAPPPPAGAGYPPAAPLPAPQPPAVQYDQYGNQYQFINGQWQMTQRAGQAAPPPAQFQQTAAAPPQQQGLPLPLPSGTPF